MRHFLQCLIASTGRPKPNVWKCPVLSGLFNPIPLITINPLYQQDLQQFPSRIRPDIPDIWPAAAG